MRVGGQKLWNSARPIERPMEADQKLTATAFCYWNVYCRYNIL